MKISKIFLSNFRNSEHMEFMAETQSVINATNMESLQISALIDSFTDTLKKEAGMLKTIQKSDLTDPIADADIRRDDIYRGLTLYIESSVYSIVPAMAETARKIQIVMDRYGNIRTKPYNEETAEINSFILELNTNHATDVSTLNIQDRLSDLEAANATFFNMMEDRKSKEAAQDHINMREIRSTIDKIYYQIIDKVNAYAVFSESHDYDTFISQMNTQIEYYKNTIVIRKGRAKAAREEKLA